MDMRSTRLAKGVLACFIAVVSMIGFTVAPAAAATDDTMSLNDVGVTDVGDAINGVVETEEVDGPDGSDLGEDVVPGADPAVPDVGATPEGPDTGTGDAVQPAPGLPDAGATPDIQDPGTRDSLPGAPGGSLDPEEFPVGDERARVNVCGPLDPSAEDLPLDVLPGVDDLPDVTGVPTKVLTYDAIFGIVFSTPSACDVVHPNEPQVDPNDPPQNPDYTFDVARSGQFRDGVVYLVYWGSTLNGSSGEPGVSGKSGLLANPEAVDVVQIYVINDGRNEYGSEFHFENIDSQTDSFKGRSTLILVDRPAGIEYRCDGLAAYQPDTSTDGIVDNPTGPCQSSFVGAPNLPPSQLMRGGMRLVETISDGESPVDTEESELPADQGELPVDVDQLLSL